ncbi:NuoI/complex I 23 kDa subunit family protein [Desulfotalea psychrophila]|uniref:NADH-quinone oxidoreductase subunit I n=1 Tax=Desulfotalea psychrophila (strain LSv54 / DSM 12343) TaxID=177439 RepID=Q6ANM9_DESPS|nr:NADH-quinone oxidoreductase subunit I [Desulfotalea psychrophila]CAG36045.1 similar to NADH dehydrogenase, subunit 8 [Desulfotalea psychrophila LSv54]
MIEFIKEIVLGLWSLIVGMRITAREFFTPKITVQYPHETEVMPARFRGHIELIGDEEGNTRCVACGMCVRACPSGCIKVSGEKLEGSKKKIATVYELDFTKCSLCGSCIESCNFGAIQFSRVYNHVSTKKEDFYYNLIKDLEEKK